MGIGTEGEHYARVDQTQEHHGASRSIALVQTQGREVEEGLQQKGSEKLRAFLRFDPLRMSVLPSRSQGAIAIT
jgi:hypothetical protein